MSALENSNPAVKNKKDTLILIEADSATLEAMTRVFSIKFPDTRNRLPSTEVLSVILSLVAKKSNLSFSELPSQSEHQVFFDEGSTLAKILTSSTKVLKEEETPFPAVVHNESFSKLEADFKLVDAWLLARSKLNNKLIAEKVLTLSKDIEGLHRAILALDYLVYEVTLLLDFWKNIKFQQNKKLI